MVQHEVSDDGVKAGVFKRQGVRRSSLKLQVGMEPTSLCHHRLSEVNPDHVGSTLRRCGGDKPRTSSHVEDPVLLGDLHFVQQRADRLSNQDAESSHVGVGAPGPRGVLKAGNLLWIKWFLCHVVTASNAPRYALSNGVRLTRGGRPHQLQRYHDVRTAAVGCSRLLGSLARCTDPAVTFTIELEREADGRWLAEVPTLPGVLCYGQDRDEAVTKVQALALRVIAERLEHREAPAEFLNVTFQAA